jgi:hypothetical protein
MNINSIGFCNWLSGVLEANSETTLNEKQVALIRERLSDAFIHDIDKTFPPEQQHALHDAHTGTQIVNDVKMGRDGVRPDSGMHFDMNSWNYEPGARC